MNVVALKPKTRTPVEAFQELQVACDVVRLEIAQATTVAEAFTLYRHIENMTRELAKLTDQAAARCEDLMREL